MSFKHLKCGEIYLCVLTVYCVDTGKDLRNMHQRFFVISVCIPGDISLFSSFMQHLTCYLFYICT